MNDYDAEKIETLHDLSNYIDNRRCECITNIEKSRCRRLDCRV